MPVIRRQFKLDAELSPILNKIEEIIQGKEFKATQAWKCKQSDGGPSLQQVQEDTPIGGCTHRALPRWREEFTTKAAKNELWHKDGHAMIPSPWQFTQEQVGRPKPPSTFDTVRSESQMEQSIVDHCVQTMITCESHLVLNSDDRREELIVNLKHQYKPEDDAHEDPRMCLGLGLANEPAKEVFEPTKRNGGFRSSRMSTHREDTASLADAPKGYKQVYQSRGSRKRQRHLIQKSLWERACTEVAAKFPERVIRVTHRHRIVIHQGVQCVIVEPTCLQFGATHSGQVFERRLGFVVSHLRQVAGLRIATQVDDIEIKSRFGPAATYLDTLIFIGTMWYFRWQLHFKEKKAMQLWPRNTWTFDGHVIRAFDLQAFSPEEKDQRHRKNLEKFIDGQDRGQSMTLRDLARVVGQQNSHRLSHFPTQYVICATSGFLSEETTRLTRAFGPIEEIWDQPIQPLPRPLIGDLVRLLEPRTVGDHLRTTGPIDASAIADVSSFRTGYQIKSLHGPVLRGNLPLLPTERKLHHTIQESVGTNEVAGAAIIELDLQGTPSKPAILSSGNDNSAAVKNINRPGNKPQMVLHQVKTVMEARRRHVIIVGQKESKYYMDHQSNINWDGRKQYRYHDLGLQSGLVAEAARVLGVPWPQRMIDMMACRVTSQTKEYVSRFPDGNQDRIPQCDVQTFDLGQHPRLAGKNLYIYPPETMMTGIVRQISEQQRVGQLIMLVYPYWQKGYSWMSEIESRVQASVLVPHHDENWVHPGGMDQTDESGRPKWPLVISVLSRTVPSSREAARSKLVPFAEVTPTVQGDSLYYRSRNLPSL